MTLSSVVACVARDVHDQEQQLPADIVVTSVEVGSSNLTEHAARRSPSRRHRERDGCS
jgi:hypothetical protein